MIWLVVFGVWAALIGLLLWFLIASRKHSDRMRISEPPRPDARSSIATHRKIMGNQNTRV